MTDVRALITDALQQVSLCGWCRSPGWDNHWQAMADAVLSLPGVAVVALPPPNFPDLPTDWFGERWTVWLDARHGIQIRDPGYEATPAGARAFAAALLAAANAAEQATNDQQEAR